MTADRRPSPAPPASTGRGSPATGTPAESVAGSGADLLAAMGAAPPAPPVPTRVSPMTRKERREAAGPAGRAIGRGQEAASAKRTWLDWVLLPG